jgi:hypothetical protein
MANERMRDPAEEREEIYRHIEEGPSERPFSNFNEELGRIPDGPSRGWRRREQKAKSCDRCEGSLWIEKDDVVLPCPCRKRRAARRAANQLQAGNWMRGTSLSFAAPPLDRIPEEVRNAVEKICGDVGTGRSATSLWLVGEEESGKSALCSYIAQRLYPTDGAIVERVGDFLAHLRWLGGVKGEVAVERRLQKLIDTPLLVLDNVDRATRSHPNSVSLGLESSCASHDLIRLARLLRERQASLKPMVVTSRAAPAECVARITSISRSDLTRGLLGTALEVSDPFEDFPHYSKALLEGGFEELRQNTALCSLDHAGGMAAAA